jgi:hypothetical protein
MHVPMPACVDWTLGWVEQEAEAEWASNFSGTTTVANLRFWAILSENEESVQMGILIGVNRVNNAAG